MIRINLLPVKQARKRESGRNQILILVIIVLVECGLCYLILNQVESKISRQTKENDVIQTQIEQIKREIQDQEKITLQLKEIEEREKIIADLQAARTGPVFMLWELSKIISQGGGPSLDKEKYQEMLRIDPASGYDETWDFRRIWIVAFTERNRQVSIVGYGLTHEDVAEFLRRLNLSDFFFDPILESTSVTKASGIKSNVTTNAVTFSIASKVRYR